jgi:NEDD8-activating enzyme E1 regulatory subunit
MATSDKYDRQLRLWGSNGQRRLSETTVFLVQATAVGCEVLKNLVLPGVGGFVVVDAASVSPSVADADANFFVPASAVNSQRSRAQAATECLQELNEDVKGECRDVHDLLSVDYGALFGSAGQGRSVLVVASDLEPPVLERVAKSCDHLRVPLVAVQSYGLMGTVRLQVPPVPLLNPKPRDGVPDLRLAAPFPPLQQLSDSVDLAVLENHEHGHVPYPIILLKVMEEWRKQHLTASSDGPHNGDQKRVPATFAEKQEFQRMVKLAARDYDAELNFQEAVQNAYLAYTSREVDRDRLAQLRSATVPPAVDETSAVASASASSSLHACRAFHAMLLGLEKFCDKHGRAPVQGSIPDMTSSTDLYVRLQALYRTQAHEDLEDLRRLTHNKDVAVDDDDLLTFCQNVFDLDLLRTRTLQEEWDEPSKPASQEICDDLAGATMEGDEREDQVPLLWGLGLAACRLFYLEAGRYPGVLDDWEADVDALQACVVRVVDRYSLRDNDLVQKTLLRNADYAAELARYGNAEVHNIASLIGGVASQEAVKIITGQYVPLDNTYVYNGITSTGGVYRF